MLYSISVEWFILKKPETGNLPATPPMQTFMVNELKQIITQHSEEAKLSLFLPYPKKIILNTSKKYI